MNEAVDKMKRDVAAIKQQQAEMGGAPADGKGKAPVNQEPQQKEEEQAKQPDQDQQQQQEKEQEPQLSERDQFELDKAIKSGWKPPDQFDGEPEDFIKPREWNRTVALYKRIDREREERERLQAEVGTFNQRIANVMKVAKETALRELEEKKQTAVEESDYTAVRQIDKEIEQTHKDYEIEEPAPRPPPVRPVLQEWFDDNPWFYENTDMQKFAVGVQTGHLAMLQDPSNPSDAELKEALKRTKRAVLTEYPDHFKKRPRHVTTTLERGDRNAAPKKLTYNDLTPQEKTVCDNIERLPGGLSREDYIQAIQDMRGDK